MRWRNVVVWGLSILASPCKCLYVCLCITYIVYLWCFRVLVRRFSNLILPFSLSFKLLLLTFNVYRTNVNVVEWSRYYLLVRRNTNGNVYGIIMNFNHLFYLVAALFSPKSFNKEVRIGDHWHRLPWGGNFFNKSDMAQTMARITLLTNLTDQLWDWWPIQIDK